MQTIIRSFTPEKGKRLLVTSDVHGHDKLLGSLLARARFSKDDTLIIVGDLLDKGPESLKTLRRVMALSRDHRVFALMGNVDCWRLNHFFSRTEAERRQAMESALWAEKYWGSSLLSECCREIGVTPSPDASAGTFERLRARFAPELAFLQGMPTLLVTPQMIFVHGGLPHENLSALEAQDGFLLLKCDHFYENGQSFEKTIDLPRSALYNQFSFSYTPNWSLFSAYVKLGLTIVQFLYLESKRMFSSFAFAIAYSLEARYSLSGHTSRSLGESSLIIGESAYTLAELIKIY